MSRPESPEGWSVSHGEAALLLSHHSWWPGAVENVRQLLEGHGAEAEQRASEFGQRFAGRRAVMVFDVVASKRRKYLTRVVPMADRFEMTDPTLQTLAEEGPGDGFGLRAGEAETMRGVAAGLLRFFEDSGEDEEAGVRAWADRVVPLSTPFALTLTSGS